MSYPLKVVQSHLEYDRKYLIKGQDITITAINEDSSTHYYNIGYKDNVFSAENIKFC